MKRDDYFTIRARKQDQYHNGVYAITSSSPKRLRNIVEDFARCLQREEHYDFPPFHAESTATHHPGYTAYLFGYRGYWVGACVFVPVNARAPDVPDADWMLGWVWMHPYCRRRNLLSQAWRQFEGEHGQFLVLAPLSHGMERFLERQGVSEDRIVCMGGTWG